MTCKQWKLFYPFFSSFSFFIFEGIVSFLHHARF